MLPYAFDIMGLKEKFSVRCHNPLNLGCMAIFIVFAALPRAVCSRPLRAAPAAQAARHQPSVLSVPCERACGLPAADSADTA
jgi:hypothetical protein